MSQVNSVNGNTLLFTGFFPPCRVGTTGSAIALAGLQTIDGVALNAGDRVLVKDQADQTTNGIYAANSGNWVRTSDALSSTQFYDGMGVMVSTGTVNAATLFLCTTLDDPVIIGTSLITFVSLSTINTVSPAMRPVVQSSTLALARSALGLGSAALEAVGRYGLADDGAGFLNATGPVSTFTSGGKTIASADNNGFFVASGAAVMTLPLGNTLPNGFRFQVFVPTGASATITPNALDAFQGSATGAAKSVLGGKLLTISGNAQSPTTWYATPAPGWQNVPLSITSATPVTNAHKGLTLQLGGGSFFKLTLPAGSTLDADFTCVIENTDGSVGKGIAGVNVGGFTLYPGESYLVYNDTNTLKLLGGSVKRYRKAGLALFVDNVNGSNDPTLADGLATGSRAFASIQGGLNALYNLFDHNQSQPTITVAAGGGYNESVIISGMPVGCANVFFINGASPGVVWAPASAGTPYCMIVSDGGIIEYSNFNFIGNGVTSGVALQMHQQAIADQNGGCSFGTFTSGSHIATDGAGWTWNINASYTVNGNAGNHVSANSPGIVNHAGSVTVTISGTPAIGLFYRLQAGGVINLGSSITYSGALTAGCQKWAVNPLSALFCGGNSASIPGSVAGSPATGLAPTAAAGWAIA
jgi:hypothetical protein